MAELWHIDALPERIQRDDWSIKEVLVEFEEPILALWHKKGDKRLHLGINARTDWSARRTRWIYAPMTEAQWEGLLRGLMPVLNIFSDRSAVQVVDRVAVTGIPVTSWTVSPRTVPTECLPVVGAPLPKDVRDYLLPKLKKASLAMKLSPKGQR